jgi:hypothetical protein
MFNFFFGLAVGLLFYYSIHIAWQDNKRIKNKNKRGGYKC